jgi:hypothetical protein
MTTPENNQTTPEPFVSAAKAAEFLGINRKFLLSLARRGIAGSYAIGGDQRHRWVFRLSELGIAIDHRHRRPFPAEGLPESGMIRVMGSPR